MVASHTTSRDLTDQVRRRPVAAPYLDDLQHLGARTDNPPMNMDPITHRCAHHYSSERGTHRYSLPLRTRQRKSHQPPHPGRNLHHRGVRPGSLQAPFRCTTATSPAKPRPGPGIPSSYAEPGELEAAGADQLAGTPQELVDAPVDRHGRLPSHT